MSSCFYTGRFYSVVSIDGKVYTKIKHPDADVNYSVHCKNGSTRTLRTPAILAQIDAAIVELAHAEALEENREYNINRDLIAGRPVDEETGADTREWSGYSIERDHAEALEINMSVDAQAAYIRCMTPESFDAVHAEALRMDAQLEQDAWDNADRVGREMAIESAHDEALTMDTEYRVAIATVADNLTLPIWDGCSATVKREVVKHHHAEALRENQKHDEAIIFFAERGPHIVVEAFTELQLKQMVAYCHGQALEMDAARVVSET